MADDQTLTCQNGAHGVAPTIFADEIVTYYDAANNVCTAPDVPVIPQSYVDDWQGMSIPPELPLADQMMAELCAQYPATGVCRQASRQTWESKTSAALDTKARIVVIHMGKAHIYPSDAWTNLGPQWKQNVTAEGDHLFRRIESSKFFVEDWENLNSGVMGTIVGGTSAGFAKFAALLRGDNVLPCPKPAKFQSLMDTVKQHRDKLSSNKKAVYRDVFEAGKQFMLTKEEHDKLRSQFELHRDTVVDGAQGMVDVVLTPVEATSFTVLDMAAKVRAAGDPMQEVLYRTQISLLHAAAKFGGEALAGSQGKGLWVPAFQQLVTDVPGIVVDGAVGKWLKGAEDGRLKTAFKVFVTESVSFFVDMIVFVVWDYDQIKPESDREKKMDEWLNARLTKAVGGLINGSIEVLLNLPKDAPVIKTWASDTVQEIVKVVLELWNKAREEHKADPNKAVWDIMLRELPETLVKAIATAILKTAIGEKFKGDSEAKKAKMDAEAKLIAEAKKAAGEQKALEERFRVLIEQQEAQRAAEERAKAAKPVPLKAIALEVTAKPQAGQAAVTGKPLKQDGKGATVPPKRQTPPRKGEPVTKADTELIKKVQVVPREPNTRINLKRMDRSADRRRAAQQERDKAEAAFASKRAAENSRQKSIAKQRRSQGGRR